MSLRAFMSRDSDERDWLLDMHRRLGPRVALSIGLLGVVLLACLPWLRLSTLPFVLGAGVAFEIGNRLVAATRRIEPIVVAWFVAQAMFAGMIAVNIGSGHGDLALLLVPVVAASGGFHDRLAAVCAVYTAGLMCLVAFAVAPGTVRTDPPFLLVPLGALAAAAILATAVRRSSIENRSMAVVDPLTGMLNRAALRTRVAELEHQADQAPAGVGMVLVDLDRFKSINDAHGHATGDRVLAQAAQRIRSCLRAFDLAYRLGGEEFLVLLPGADEGAATDVARRLVAALAAEPMAGVRVTGSAGVAASQPGSRFVFDEVFTRADRALYEAKAGGRDQVRTASEPDAPQPRAASAIAIAS